MGFEILKSLLFQLTSTLPNLLVALVFIIAGYYIAKLTARFLQTLLRKIGLDSITEKINDIDIVRKSNLKIQLSSIIAKTVYYFIFLVFIIAATDSLRMPAISDLVMKVVNFIPNALVALIVLLVGLLAANGMKNIIFKTCRSLNIPSASIISNAVFYFIFISVGISALNQAQIDTTFLRNNLTVILGGVVAAFALGYGLASKEVMLNLMASYYSKGNITVGDTVQIGNLKGKVIHIDNSTVKLQSGEQLIIFPLHKLLSEAIIVTPSDNLKIDA